MAISVVQLFEVKVKCNKVRTIFNCRTFQNPYIPIHILNSSEYLDTIHSCELLFPLSLMNTKPQEHRLLFPNF